MCSGSSDSSSTTCAVRSPQGCTMGDVSPEDTHSTNGSPWARSHDVQDVKKEGLELTHMTFIRAEIDELRLAVRRLEVECGTQGWAQLEPGAGSATWWSEA